MATTLISNTWPASVVNRKPGSPIVSIAPPSREVEGRPEGLDLLHQRFGEPLAGDEGNAGNVVDRLLRIELGALAAGLVQNVDEMRLHVQKAEFEYGEKAEGTRPNNQDIGFDRFAHLTSRLKSFGGCACLANAEGSGKPKYGVHRVGHNPLPPFDSYTVWG